MHTDTESCLRAVRSKDARFDGWFFTAVLTTGIYCRPSCPVVPPKPGNMRFYPSAAACQQAGFRACKRCRPDTSPGSPEWNHRADLVARAMRLIAEGIVDREGVAGLAARLGYSTRQIERQLLAELGAGPLALARAQRAQTARILIETTQLPMADVAFAAGFASVRTFNDTVREVFALAPSELRTRTRTRGSRQATAARRADGATPAPAPALGVPALGAPALGVPALGTATRGAEATAPPTDAASGGQTSGIAARGLEPTAPATEPATSATPGAPAAGTAVRSVDATGPATGPNPGAPAPETAPRRTARRTDTTAPPRTDTTAPPRTDTTAPPPTGPAFGTPTPGTISLRLPFRAPLTPDNLFGHLVATAVPGVEEWRGGAYRRTLRLPYGHGIVALTPRPDHIGCRLTLTDQRDLTVAISRCRRMLDLDADPVAVDEQLRADPLLAPLVDKAPGRRVPRTVDEAEFAVRAVLGQQVSTAAARTHAARLVMAHGEPVDDPEGGLTHLFPEPAALAALDPEALALPRSRRATLLNLVRALADGSLALGVESDWAQARARLRELPGFGPWTVDVIAMRALGDPDAFLATDLGVRRAAEGLGLPSTPTALTARAAAWRPWRAYAVQYLWATDDHPINRLPS